MPKVTVAMPVFNDAKYLKSAIASILAQSFQDFELLVIDDGSTDESPAILDSYTDKRMKVIRLPQNKGRPYARNIALDNATGEYLAWMDGDDISHPQRLERQVNFLDAHPQVDICGCALQCFHERKDILHYPYTSEQIRAAIIWDSMLPNPVACMRLERVRKAHMRYDEELLRAEDYGFWIDALLGARLQAINMPDVLYQWRYFQRPANVMYHALAARHVLKYLDLPHDPHHATVHTVFSCTSYEGLEPSIDAYEVINWINEVYHAVLRSNLVTIQPFLARTHIKVEKYLAWQPLSKSLLQYYHSSPLGKTHSSSRICTMVALRKLRKKIYH